ncbi:hypothetical protein EMCRGX_G004413 [Ephydatia muelleri]
MVKNSRVQEPNVETDHLESSTSGSVNLLNQSFDTRFQPTRQDVCMLVRRACTSSSSGPKPTRWAGVFSVPKAGTCIQFQQWRPTENVVTVPLTPHPSSTSKMGEHSHLKAFTPPFYPCLVPAMGAMQVVVAAARVAAGEVVVEALVPILVGLVQVAVLLLLVVVVRAALLLLLLAVGAALLLLLVVVGAALLLLLLVAVGAALLLLLVVVGAALLLLLVAVGAALLLLLAADGRGAALHLAAAGAESQQNDTHAQLKYYFLLISMH